MNSYNNRAVETPKGEIIDLKHHWLTITRRKWMVIGLVSVVILVTAFTLHLMPEIYRATTTILIESGKSQVISIEEVYSPNTASDQYYMTQLEILKSREVATRVVNRLNLVDNALFNSNKQGIQDRILEALGLGAEDEEYVSNEQKMSSVVRQFQRELSITPVRKTQLIKISYESQDSELAALITDTVADEYITSQMEEKLAVTARAADWLNERLGDLRKAVYDSEQRLQEYREATGLVDVEGVRKLDANKLTQLTQLFVEASKSRAEAEILYRQVAQFGSSAPIEELMTIPAIGLDPLVRNLKQEQVRSARKVAELSKRYGPKHPKLIAAISDEREAYSSLAYQVQRVRSSIETRYHAERESEQAIKARIAENKESFQNVNRQEFKSLALEREVTANKELYNLFLSRMKETGEAGAFAEADARVVEAALTPEFPVKPKKRLILALTTVVSAVLACMLAFLFEALNSTVRTPDEVEEKLGVPMMGFLPLVSSNRSKLPFEGFVRKTKGVFAESVRTIRTALVLSGIDRQNKIVLVTSSVPGEGKSTVALNLARAFSQVEKVLLIDADMRRPSLSRVLDLPRGTFGLSNWVAGTAKISQIIYQMDDWPVDVMPSGTIPHNPLELLSSQRINAALENLKQHYDRIIIDSAPICAVSDALVLARQSDTLVYVIKSDSTTTGIAARGINSFKEIDKPLYGVLNQVDVKKYNYYYSGYYQNYGYSSEEEFHAQKKYQKPREDEHEYVQPRVSKIGDV